MFRVHLRVLLFAQVLHAAFEGEAGLAWLVLLQGLLAEVVEELDVQQDQDVADFLDPVFGFVRRQEAVVGGAGDLAVKGFEQEADVLGFGFGQDRCRRVVDRNRFALGYQCAEFSDPCLDRGAGFFRFSRRWQTFISRRVSSSLSAGVMN